MKLLFLSAASLLAVAAPAYAQTDDARFDGPYVGAAVGYSVQNNDVDETILFDRDLNGSFGDVVVTSGGANAFSPGFCNGAGTATTPGVCTNDDDGINFSGRIGWDFQRGNMVFGVVADAGRADITDSVTAYSTTPARYTMTREIDYTASLRARVGYAAGGKTLFYATGGGAYARVDHIFSTTNTANSFTQRGRSDSFGWVAGGGVEQSISRNLSIGVEYTYTRLQDDDARVRVGAGTAPATNPFLLAGAGGTDFRRSDNRFDFHGVRATAAFRF